MIVNRLREWRERRGLSLDELAEKVGSSRTTVHRLEKQTDAAIHELIVPIAAALNVRFVDLFADAPVDSVPLSLPGATAIRFAPPPGHRLNHASLGPDEAFYQLLTDDLSEIGLYRGDIAIVVTSAAEIANVMTGDAVIASLAGDHGDPILVHRQFLSPHLLVANGPAGGAVNLHVVRDGVTILGIVRGRHGELRLAQRHERM
jgi:transcriptional regulator with XRE-family HTH domain